MATTRRLFLSAALIASGLGIGTGFAPTANACGPGGDLNVLCPMEQKYVDDLAAIGINPKSRPRELANTGSVFCGYLINAYRQYPGQAAAQGVKDNLASTIVANNPELSWQQAQGWVQAAVNNMCTDAMTGMHYQ